MTPECTLCTLVLMLSPLTWPARSGMQRVQSVVASSAGGFRTDRLSQRQIRIWDAVRRVVLATDARGRPMHPNLYGLWSTVGQSGHPVFVELITDKKKCSNQAGECAFEMLDPAGRVYQVRLRLFIPTIDRAYAGEQPSQDGIVFVPFSGLSREERYAKVLGHELAHIDRAVADPDYLHLLQEICTEQTAIAAGVGADGQPLPAAALRARWNLIWPLVLESDRPAITAEAEIYRELLARR